MKDKFLFSVKPELSAAETVRIGVKSALDDWLKGRSDSRADDFCQVVSELVNNAVEHGKCSTLQGELSIEAGKASFTMTTDGIHFDPTAKKAEMPDFDEKDDLPEGGYGLAIINQLSDEFSYSYRDGKNVTVVVKLFGR